MSHKANKGVSVLPVIIGCLTLILLIINITVPLMGNSIADAHVRMMEAGSLFEEDPDAPVDFSIDDMPNPAAHLGMLNAIIAGVQLILIVIFIILQSKQKG